MVVFKLARAMEVLFIEHQIFNTPAQQELTNTRSSFTLVERRSSQVVKGRELK